MFKLIDYVPRSLSRFISDKRGQVAMIFGLSLIPVTGGVGAAIDYSTISHVKAQLQASLDSAVLAGALDQTSNQNTTATNVFATNFQPNYSGVTYSNLVFSVRGDGAFTGSVKATVPTTFMNVLGVPTVLVATTSAAGPSAVAANGNALCLLALNATAQSAIDDSGGTSVSAPNCIVQVNSSNSKAVTLSGSAAISSAENCFVGKVSTSGSASVKPGPDAVCNSKSDPFKNRSVPSVSSCDYTNFKTSTPITLQPGVYCGGISISSTTVTFAPGLYIIKGGLLTSSGGSKITGNGVSFYLTGSDTGVSTSGGSAWHIVAMSSGTLAGFVFFLDPYASASQKSELSGSSELYFEGVIYLPNQQLTLSGQSSAFTPSPFTAYIADTFALSGSAALTILSDATKTSVPIPSELLSGSGGQKLHLIY